MGRLILAILAGTGSAFVLGVVYWGLLILLKPALDRLRLTVQGDAPVHEGHLLASRPHGPPTTVSPVIEADGVIARPVNYFETNAVYKLDPNYQLDLNYKLGPEYKLDVNCGLDPSYKLDLMRNYVLNPTTPLKTGLVQELRIATVSLQQQYSAVVCGKLGQSYGDLGQFIYVNAGVTLAPSEFLIDPAERHLLLTFSKQKAGGFQEPDEAPKDLAGIALQGTPSPEFYFARGRKSASRVPSLAC